MYHDVYSGFYITLKGDTHLNKPEKLKAAGLSKYYDLFVDIRR